MNLDAVVLAVAGLRRLGRSDAITEILDPTRFVPPPRKERWRSNAVPTTLAAREVLAAFDDAGTRACITAERALLAALEAGCSAPIGALAEIRRRSSGAHFDSSW